MVNNALSIIDGLDLRQVETSMQGITRFQNILRGTLKQNLDFGLIPGTLKPTLLKPGAEKILMLLSVTSEYDVIEKTEDYKEGVFAYTVKCRLSKGGVAVTEGLGSCNSKEDKYRWRWVDENVLPYGIDKTTLKQKRYGDDIKYRIKGEDAFNQVNTILKMAKKRAQVDAVLTIASLSEIFTQDLDDMDLSGNPTERSYAQKMDNPGDYILTFGQHKGKRLSEIPIDYVKWLSRSAREESLKALADSYLADTSTDAPDSQPTSKEDGLATEAQVKAIYASAKSVLHMTSNDEVKEWASAILEKDVASMKSVTKEDASTLISELNRIKDLSAQS